MPTLTTKAGNRPKRLLILKGLRAQNSCQNDNCYRMTTTSEANRTPVSATAMSPDTDFTE